MTTHDHDHGEFIAHHFDSAEQQFDSGKLGIWLFLVTEVLFFSGLFVAYTLYRNHHPEIFEQAHVFLDKYPGGLNTVVLLFSSLTMALGVRAAQLGENKNCAVYILITMVCAAVFLGVKAVEYSHKWDMGILVRSAFQLHERARSAANCDWTGVAYFRLPGLPQCDSDDPVGWIHRCQRDCETDRQGTSGELLCRFGDHGRRLFPGRCRRPIYMLKYWWWNAGAVTRPTSRSSLPP